MATLYNYHVTAFIPVNNNTVHVDNHARNAKIRQRRTYFPVRNPIVSKAREIERANERGDNSTQSVERTRGKCGMDDEEKRRAPAAV